MSELHVGIDLGTTYSLVSVVLDGVPRVIKNGLGELLTPSAVHVTADGTAGDLRLGGDELTGIPAGPAGTQTIAVRFTYDMNGVLDVDTTICSTGETAVFTIESVPGRLSKKAIAKARARLKRLKFQPRDALPNVTALARADALYVELTGEDRAVLGACINELRLALEQQATSQISASRERLLRLVSELDRRG
jgi:molecular chaperone HscC